MRIELRTVELPDFGAGGEPPTLDTAEYEARVAALYERAGVDWVLVYADREHAANLAFLTGFDPRFEEALLLLGPDGRRLLCVGNEGLLYAPVARLPAELLRCQTFSLMGQRRDDAPRLADALRTAGIGRGARVGLAGWKYLEPEESDDWAAPGFVPAFVVTTVQALTGTPALDVTRVLMHPAEGLRVRNTAAQIACFEWAAARASAAVRRVVLGARPGRTELAAVGAMGYEGEPLSAHVMFASGRESIIGLRSPSPKMIERGDGATTAIGYWGGLSCRAGLVDEAGDERFLHEVAYPYFSAIATWYAALRLGAPGGTIHDAVAGAFAGVPFGSLLNPGHLISLDEWVHSPIRPGSGDRIASGMALQCDIIPFPLRPGWAINCEDTLAVADSALREEIASSHPDLWRRVVARRSFLRERLGIEVADEVLPLSSTPAYLPPFWLDDALVCVVAA
jgi:hypothetical protein